MISEIQKELQDTFDISWQDNVKARLISATQDNAYVREGGPAIRSQFAIYDYYQEEIGVANDVNGKIWGYRYRVERHSSFGGHGD